MQAIETRAEDTARQRVEAVVRTLAGMKHRGGTVAEIAHDARNMVTALGLYCDLLSEPGVLCQGHGHYANELRLVTAASRRLVEKLMILDLTDAVVTEPAAPGRFNPKIASDLSPRVLNLGGGLTGDPIENLQKELLANRNLLDAMAGLAISLNVRTEGGARSVSLSREDLTRVLVNLVKNAAEAMRQAGSIDITLRELPDAQGKIATVALILEDSGPGIREGCLELIFDAGFTSHTQGPDRVQDGGWPATHRGLGLSITRSILEAAGGRIVASNRPHGGARFEITLPIRSR